MVNFQKKRRMKKILAYCLLLLLTFTTAKSQNISLQTFATGFSLPVDLAHAGDDNLYVVEKAGRIKVITPGSTTYHVYLDISSIVLSSGSEQGLLGLAFHPNYASNGYFYVYYTTGTGSGTSVVARYTRSSNNPLQADASSAQVLLTIPQPYTNHNGGCLKFGPDGYLYISLGDGGSAGDPQANAQNLNSRLGKLLRIDVNSTSGSLNYSIPSTNPFVGVANAQPEIWAYGLRNPWRFSFDRLNGDLWMGDVGQNVWEEINRQPAGVGGQNYGWRCYEGNAVYNTTGCASASTMTPPVYVYQHVNGDCSVTGGFVYRGALINSLWGKYLFTDFCSGLIRALTQTPNNTYNSSNLLDANNNQHVSFGEDRYGELYIVQYQVGSILKIVDNSNCKPKAFITTAPVECGTSVVLNALYHPSLTYQWQRNGSNISGATNNSYTATQSGNYRVIVKRTGSGCNASDTSAVYYFPGCPTPAIGTISTTSNSAQINWSAQACAQRYRLQYRIQGSSTWTSINGLTNTTTTINGLIPATTYQVRVRTQCSTNGSWLSDWSAITNFTTVGGVANCAPPTGVSVSNITANSAQVNWQLINGAYGYRVRFRPIGAGSWTVLVVNSSTVASLTLSNLSSSTAYEVQVCTKCQNDPIQLSAYSASVSFSTPAQRIEESIENDQILAYPNPTHDVINILVKATDDEDLNILLYNANGQLVLLKMLNGINRSQVQTINIGHLPDGIYLLEVLGNNSRRTMKMIKQ
jgi:glucose/arabinose dehydrogenase